MHDLIGFGDWRSKTALGAMLMFARHGSIWPGFVRGLALRDVRCLLILCNMSWGGLSAGIEVMIVMCSLTCLMSDPSCSSGVTDLQGSPKAFLGGSVLWACCLCNFLQHIYIYIISIYTFLLYFYLLGGCSPKIPHPHPASSDGASAAPRIGVSSPGKAPWG